MPDPVLPGRAGLYLSMLHYGLTGYGDFAREHAGFYQTLRERVGAVDGRRVLDIGCGKSYWLTLLLASDGAVATGVDTEEVEPGRSLAKYRRILKRNGVERALRTAVWDFLFARPYFRELGKAFGKPLRFDRCDVRGYDGVNLDLADGSVDLVVSHEVFEHVSDLDALLVSMHRVMKPQATTYIYVHSFTSLSGGHHIAWKHPDTRPSKVVAPWDHLRARRHADIPSWLNGLRERDYRAAFERYFDIVHWLPAGREGAALLTDAVRRELAEYSEDELLTKGFIVIATRKTAAPTSSPSTQPEHGA
jgi:SAM-dependent methyltransferase